MARGVWSRSVSVVMVITVVVTVGGCGRTRTGQQGGVQSPTSASPAPVGGGTVGPSEDPSPPRDPIDVSVTPDKDRYPAQGLVSVTVTNAGKEPVFADDQKSDCSIVSLQRQNGPDWVTLLACGSERAPRVVRVGAGERHSVGIDLASEHFRPVPVPPGRYRVMFSYRRAEAPQGSEPEQAVSGTFAVG